MWTGKPPFEDGEALPDIEMLDNGLDNPCSWLDQETKQCKHYDQRPNICRDFVVGSNNCLSCREQFSR